MNIKEWINQATGKNKLLTELKTNETEITNLQYNNQSLKNKVNNLENTLGKFKTQFEKLKNGYTQLKERQIRQETLNRELVDIIKDYQTLYGEVQLPPSDQNLVNDFDMDKDFFDAMSQIKGNPFNQYQVQAIRYNMEKNLRIVAGAGSGKTDTICVKAAYLTMMHDIAPSAICMVTFTNKAAEEMKTRVNKFLRTDNNRIMIGTFHGIFKSIYKQLLKQNQALSHVGIQGEKEENSEQQAKELFKELLSKYRLHALNQEGEKKLIERIDYWTSLGYSVEEMKSFIAKYYSHLEELPDYPIQERFGDLFNDYEHKRAEQEIVIFSDFLMNLYHVLLHYKSVRILIQQKFKYIFVDEFQDINPIQMEMLNLIAPPDGSGAKLIIVGDDDQSIYAFRGSDPVYIKHFHQTYATETIELMMNYRSAPNIVKAGNRVIAWNGDDRIPKTMNSFHTKEEEAFVWCATDPSAEANWILSKAESLGKRVPFTYADKNNTRVEPINYARSTVLYRSSSQLQAIYQALDARAIPYVIDSKEDNLGVFNISQFKKAFKSWSELFKVNALKDKACWNMVMIHIASTYFIKTETCQSFLQSNSSKNAQELITNFIDFVKVQKPNNDASLVSRYLIGLVKMVHDPKKVVILELIELLLQFPTVKKNIEIEHIDWLKKEGKVYATWSDLITYYNRLVQQSKMMKKNLELYHAGNYNALYFMTIHKSKGLAFKNVFVIGVYDKGLPSNRAVDLKQVNIQESKEKAEPFTTIQEERRLMYVAATRAEDNLYITFPKTFNDKPVKRSPFLKELNLPIYSK